MVLIGTTSLNFVYKTIKKKKSIFFVMVRGGDGKALKHLGRIYIHVRTLLPRIFVAFFRTRIRNRIPDRPVRPDFRLASGTVSAQNASNTEHASERGRRHGRAACVRKGSAHRRLSGGLSGRHQFRRHPIMNDSYCF